MRLRIERMFLAAALVSAAACTAEPLENGGPLNAGVGGATGGTGQVVSGGVGGTNGVAGVGGAAGAAGVGEFLNSGGMVANSGGVGGAVGGSGGDTQAGSGGTGGKPPGDQCKLEDAFEPLVAREGETCYEFLMHDGDGVSPFIVRTFF